MPAKGQFLVEHLAGKTPKARQHAQPETAALPTGGAVECGNEFHRLTTLDNLYACWLHARQAKLHNARVQRFDADPLRYLTIIQERLRGRTYTFGPYSNFIVREKKHRLVVDAPMKDRVVHWMLYSHLLPIWQPRFIHDTFGNLPGRGTHAAVLRLADFMRKPTNTWALQLDISKYFHAVPHDQLKACVLQHLGDEDLRRLIASLIDSYRTDGRYDELFAPGSRYRQTSAKGMPIGNLTSQLFANVYLKDFDHWMKEDAQVKHYIRYVDDLVILGQSREELQQISDQIVQYLDALGLTIHPRKIRLAPTRAGVPFLGYVVWPEHISAGQYMRKRYHHRLREHETQGRDRTEALRSYRAMLNFTGTTRGRRGA
jgi:RNA-directed DNA polymerase